MRPETWPACAPPELDVELLEAEPVSLDDDFPVCVVAPPPVTGVFPRFAPVDGWSLLVPPAVPLVAPACPSAAPAHARQAAAATPSDAFDTNFVIAFPPVCDR